MGANSFTDVPGCVTQAQIAFASIASNAASATYPITKAVYAGSVKSCVIIPSTSSASVAGKNAGITLINSGSAGTGTTVLGTLNGTVAYASYTPLALSLAASGAIAAGDVISLAWASASSTTVIPAGVVKLELSHY